MQQPGIFEGHNTLVRGRVKVEWVDLGEGWDGDYDPDDPSDTPLLRFDVSYLVLKGENYPYGTEEGIHTPDAIAEETQWVDFRDASYCTQFPATATEEEKRQGLTWLMNQLYDEAQNGDVIKKLCENLSWISLGTIK